MEYSVTENGVAGGPKSAIFMQVLRMPQFQIIKNTLDAKLDVMLTLSGIFAHETFAPFTAETHGGREYEVLRHPMLRKDYKADMEKAVHSIIDEMNETVP